MRPLFIWAIFAATVVATGLFALSLARWEGLPPPSRYVTVTPGVPHQVCLKIKEEVIPETCRTVYGAATVSVRIITATP